MFMDELKVFKANEVKNLHVYGRSPFTAQGSLALFWAASGFSVDTCAGEVWAELESDFSVYEPWVSVWINGVQVSRFMVQKGRGWYCLMRGLSQEKISRFTLLKETQAMSGEAEHSLIVHSVGVKKQFAESKSQEEIFVPQKERKPKIEFIGDSITTGEGLAGGVEEMDWITAWMAMGTNYALNTAKNLGADFRLISQSGWGVCCGYNNDVNMSLPPKYEAVAGVLWGKKNEELGALKPNDFSAWQPDVVVVNLGTNDNGAFHSPEMNGFKLKMVDENVYDSQDVEFFKKSVYDFMAKIHRLNPKAKIIWAYGMCGYGLGEEIRQAVEKFAAENKDACVCFQKLCDMSEETQEEKGSRGHPGKGTHARACEILTKKIQEIL